MVCDVVESVDFSDNILKCIGESGVVYSGKTIIVATGAASKWLEVPGETKYLGAGVSACATCDGFFFRNKDIAVIGGGNTAVEEAIFLTNFAKSVTLIHRRDILKAEKVMQKRLLDNPKINIIWNTIVVEILGDEHRVTDLSLKNVKTGECFMQHIDGVFIAIGHKPATDIFKNTLDLDEEGYIVTESLSSCTSVKGVFAAGDVCDPIYRQAITSAAQGCMAAMDADRFLSLSQD
jgi:thioredoxin reductase (NADPH)